MIRKTALVVGATSGIGLEVVKKFVNNGYDVFATYNKGDLCDLEDIFVGLDSKLYTCKVDVKNAQDIKNLFKKIEKDVDFLDCVVYCPGISYDEKMLIDVDDEEIEEILNVNLKGAIIAGREAMRFFVKRKHGSIIFISSIYGIYGGACESVYSASKGGMIALSKAMAQECGAFNVRVNCVAPGFIDTKMTAKFNEEERERIIESTPLKRLGRVDDVANAVGFLASEESSFITGQVIEVAGGAVKF